jgi:hypothetical protein
MGPGERTPVREMATAERTKAIVLYTTEAPDSMNTDFIRVGEEREGKK